MKFAVYAYELKVGETYTMRNEYNHEFEYGEVKYSGTAKDKYGETMFLFSDGSLVEEKSINNGCICK